MSSEADSRERLVFRAAEHEAIRLPTLHRQAFGLSVENLSSFSRTVRKCSPSFQTTSILITSKNCGRF
jgi:hypothetical protein